MDYPLFLVPHIGGSWLIGAVAIFHVIIAHFAIGGGLLTVVTEQLSARRENALWLAFAVSMPCSSCFSPRSSARSAGWASGSPWAWSTLRR